MSDEVAQKIQELFGSAEERRYKKGDILINDTHDPEGVFLLLDGIVEQYDSTPQGNKVTVNMFKPSSFFPMSWAINHTPNQYVYAALTDVRVKCLPAKKVVAYLQGSPEVVFDLLSRVYRGTDALLRRLTLAASGAASTRLVFELLIEAHRFGKHQPDGRSAIAIKHSALAARCGLARETVSRELRKLENEKVLERRGQVLLLAIHELESKLTFSV